MSEKRIIDIRTVTLDGPEIHFLATDAERRAIAERFCIPRLDNLEVHGCFGRDSVEDLITFDGKMTAVVERECVITLRLFSEKMTMPVHLLFSEIPSSEDENPEIDILPISNGKINLVDVFGEEFGLSLNPFPKSVSDYLDYRDPTDTPDESPFSILKKIK